MRVAVVHDWLYVLGGAERVLKGILRCYPGADVFCLFDLLPASDRRKIGYETSHASFLQKMPGIRHHQLYLPLMPLAIEQTDLRDYDLIISSSYAVAKGIITGPDQLHVSYVHSPMRYAWDLQQTYLEEARLDKGIRTLFVRLLLHWMRIWDTRTANGVDAYIANSRFVARRIHKLYGRDSEVIYPPVTVPTIVPTTKKEKYFLTASRLVPYKNTRIIVEAFRALPDEKLLVVGNGPELASLKERAGPNVQFLGFVEDSELQTLMRGARAFIFAAHEDFGIVVVEAQGQGTPVIALGKGGARETVVAGGAAPTGLFFDEPNSSEVAHAVSRFIRSEAAFLPVNCHRNALRFSEERFDHAFKKYVDECWERFQASLVSPVPNIVPPMVIAYK